jgi:hypothetical protein
MEGKRTFHSPEAEIAFWAQKESLATAPILGYTWPVKNFIINTDAGKVCVGGMLSQVQDSQKSAAAYYSKNLSKAGNNYCVT